MSHRSQLTSQLYSLTRAGAPILSKCWKITRRDGTVFRFTDHSKTIVFRGEEYSPVGSFRVSAEEGEDGLTPSNREIQGIITSSKITDTDLRAGKYRLAVIEEFAIPAHFPWDAFRASKYWIKETRFNGQMWVAQLDGPLVKLGVTVGYTVERKCRWRRFGDSNCAFDLDSVRQTGKTVSSVETASLRFGSDITTGNGDNYFNDGKIEWQTGLNAGIESDIKDYTELGGDVLLYVKTPNPIQVGDTFDIVPGCDRQFSTCLEYENTDRFGGCPDIPGNQDLLTTPEAPPAEIE